MLKKIQILESEKEIIIFNNLTKINEKLGKLSEFTENWMGKEDTKSLKDAENCILLLEEISNYLTVQRNQKINLKKEEEPDCEIMPQNDLIDIQDSFGAVFTLFKLDESNNKLFRLFS